MSHAQNLDRASSYFFFAGLVLGKLQYIPIALISSIFKLISLGLYLVGYALWWAGSELHPYQQSHDHEWYGFAPLKEQNIYASAIGLIATLLNIAAVFIPVLFPAAALLYLASNVIWAISEYHKLQNPPSDDTNFSHSRQKIYVSYAIIATSISLITAVAAVLIFFFPPLIIPVTILSIIMGTALGGLAMEYWMESSYGDHKTTQVHGSYFEMTELMHPELSVQEQPAPAPHADRKLFAQEEVTLGEAPPLVSDDKDNDSVGCFSCL